MIFLLHKIYIDAFFCKIGTITNIHSFMKYIIVHYITHDFYIMGRTCIENRIIMVFPDIIYVYHLQTYSSIIVYFCPVRTINSSKQVFVFSYAKMISEFYNAASAIATLAALSSISIEL